MPLSKALFIISLLLAIHLAYADYDPALGVEYAQISALSYCTASSIQSFTCGSSCSSLSGWEYYFVQSFSVHIQESLQFAMVTNPASKRFVTAFRGTVTAFELFVEFIERGSESYGLSDVNGGLVDSYFYDHYVNYLRDSFLDQLRGAIAKFPDYEFVFTGHSLGAAFTTIAAFDVVSSGILPKEKVVVYNYGSPRVMNQAMVEQVEAALPEFYRVVHDRDTVPHLPLCQENANRQCVPSNPAFNSPVAKWPAWHVNTEIFYNEDNTSYQVCPINEDPQCSDQFPLLDTNVLDHLHYLGIFMECDNTAPFGIMKGLDKISTILDKIFGNLQLDQISV